jgi:hypothetical protein
MSGSFDRDERLAKLVRDEILKPAFYARRCTEGRFVFCDKGGELVTLLQRRMAVDTICQGDDGLAYGVEEKAVRWPKSGKPYSAYSLETESCTNPGRESPGWMVYGHEDLLLYSFLWPDRLVCHLIDFPPLKAWFWKEVETFPKFQRETENRTAGRVVPFDRVVAAGIRVEVEDFYPDPESEHFRELFPNSPAQSAFDFQTSAVVLLGASNPREKAAAGTQQ